MSTTNCPGPLDFVVTGTELCQVYGGERRVFTDAADQVPVDGVRLSTQAHLARMACRLARKAGSRAWRAEPDGAYTALSVSKFEPARPTGSIEEP